MKDRLLYISNIADKRMTGSFNGTAIAAAHNLGKEFINVANRSEATESDTKLDEEKWGVKLLHIDLERSPYKFCRNYRAYRQLIKIIKDYEIEYIHCNTPVGGLLGRLAGKRCKVKKVIYQVHGFHFYKGASIKNWLIYYPVEKWLAHYTDALITINREDFVLAKSKMRLRKNGKVYYVPGVGIDTMPYDLSENSRHEKRCELKLGENDIALISMGDLIERKNYDTAIRAIAEANEPKLNYFICGKGPEEANLKLLVKSLGISEQIHFLGFRSDIKELLDAVDIFLFTTKQERLPRSMMEAMASGLPCVVSKIRENIDLLKNVNGGFLCEATDVSAYAEKLKLLANDTALRKKMGTNNLITIQKFNTEIASEELRKAYEVEFSLGKKRVTNNGCIRSLPNYFPLWAKKRIELNIPIDAFVLISVGELNVNKNNHVIISAIERLRGRKIHYILCGIGEQQEALQEQADKAGLCDNIHFLGYRDDVKELYEAADCFVMPSFREGLSRSIMEAMASGKPCVVSNIRGNIDLVEEGKGGFLCNPLDSGSFAKAINSLFNNKSLCEKMSKFNKIKVKNFDVSVVEKAMRDIYGEVL